MTNLKQATPAERLKHIRIKARLTRPYLAKKYGIPEATLKAWENDTSPLTEKGLKRCIDMYRNEGIALSKEWVETGKGLPPEISVDIGRYFAADLQYPMRHEPGAKLEIREGETIFQYEHDDTACMLQEANFFKQSYPDSVLLMIANDDMEPVYQIGDLVGGRFRSGEKLESILKRDCIVRLKTGEDILRRVFKSSTGPHYNLACVNPMPTSSEPIMFNVEIESAAPVIWHRMPNK